MVNMIVYDANGEPIEFDDEFSRKLESDSKSKLEPEKVCNATIRSKKGIPNIISIETNVHSNPSLKEKKKDKCKNNILQNLKNTNVKISLLELFETLEEHILTLFELISGIDVDIDISPNILVGLVDGFKQALTFIEDELPS